MLVTTTRFGSIEIEPEDIILFPHGIVGYEDMRHWVLLSDPNQEAVAWLQSITHADVALATVSPRRYIANYRLRVTSSDLSHLNLESSDDVFVLVVVNRNEGRRTLNLRAPIVINLNRLLGRQMISLDEQQPIQFGIDDEAATAEGPTPLRKSA